MALPAVVIRAQLGHHFYFRILWSSDPPPGGFNMFIKLLAEFIGTFWLVLGGCVRHC
jgi:hypothetical protein